LEKGLSEIQLVAAPQRPARIAWIVLRNESDQRAMDREDFRTPAAASAFATCPLWVDAVEKVENRTTPKISRKSNFRRRNCCKAFYSR